VRTSAVSGGPGRTIAVLDYGIGNLRSAEKALVHLGAPARLVDQPDEVAEAAGVVLPGVGAFGACAAALAASGLEAAARRAIERGVPFLGICIGFQLLYERSDESPEVPGLGALAGTVRRLPPGVKHPQMQWNRVDRRPGATSGLLEGLGESPWMYFVHSFAPPVGPETVATCDYGGTVAAAIERDNVWGTQFHPEKSGTAGLTLLANFVARCGVTVPPPAGAAVVGPSTR
jgi:imidazole glycerol-phosphate synthase subunit HisH